MHQLEHAHVMIALCRHNLHIHINGCPACELTTSIDTLCPIGRQLNEDGVRWILHARKLRRERRKAAKRVVVHKAFYDALTDEEVKLD